VRFRWSDFVRNSENGEEEAFSSVLNRGQKRNGGRGPARW
jgi:hypothetical protein